jgi:ATP/maltotriose-dependent transcriptional regulator MalT
MSESKAVALDEQTSPTETDKQSLITLSQARAILHIGHTKLSELVKLGEQTDGREGLRSSHSSLDRRAVFIERSEIEALRAALGVPLKEARRQLGVSQTKMREIIVSGALILRPHPFYKGRQVVDAESLLKLLSERKALSSTRQALSSREIEVLDRIARGLSNREIAAALQISEHAVDRCVESIFQKFSVSDRTAAVVHALRNGWITVPSG